MSSCQSYFFSYFFNSDVAFSCLQLLGWKAFNSIGDVCLFLYPHTSFFFTALLPCLLWRLSLYYVRVLYCVVSFRLCTLYKNLKSLLKSRFSNEGNGDSFSYPALHQLPQRWKWKDSVSCTLTQGRAQIHAMLQWECSPDAAWEIITFFFQRQRSNYTVYFLPVFALKEKAILPWLYNPVRG